MDKTLYLSNIVGDEINYLAQIDSGALFYLPVNDVDSFTDANDIERVHYLDENNVDA
jgi:hypothetical protein